MALPRENYCIMALPLSNSSFPFNVLMALLPHNEYLFLNGCFMESDRMQLGRQTINQLVDGGDERLMKNLGKTAPDLAKYVLEFVFGDVYARPGLDLKTKQMLTVTILAVLGTAKPQLEYHIKAALNIGISKDEIISIMTHLAPYAGFPAALNGIAVANEVFEKINANT